MTKLELQQINTKLSTENAELRAQLSVLRHDTSIPASTRRQAMQHARQLALTTKQVVKV